MQFKVKVITPKNFIYQRIIFKSLYIILLHDIIAGNSSLILNNLKKLMAFQRSLLE